MAGGGLVAHGTRMVAERENKDENNDEERERQCLTVTTWRVFGRV